MQVVFVAGWIVPHLVLSAILLGALYGLPRVTPRVHLTVDPRIAVPLALALPITTFFMRFAVHMELEMISNGMHEGSAAAVRIKWGSAAFIAPNVVVGAASQMPGQKPIVFGDLPSFAVVAAIYGLASFVAVFWS